MGNYVSQTHEQRDWRELMLPMFAYLPAPSLCLLPPAAGNTDGCLTSSLVLSLRTVFLGFDSLYLIGTASHFRLDYWVFNSTGMRFVSMLGPSTTNVPEIFPMCPSARNISKASDLLSPGSKSKKLSLYLTR